MRTPTAVALAVLVSAVVFAESVSPRDAAVLLYDEERYAEARTAIEALDASGAADGALLYRLFFCRRVAGDESAQDALDRARKALEKENAAPKTLETPFYLANTYANLGRAAEAKDVAAAATARIDSGSWKAPKTGIGLFQLAKLYQDQGRESDAVRTYRLALDRLETKDGRYAGNVLWALRYTGNVAFAHADFQASAKAFSKVTALPHAVAADWVALASSQARLGEWTNASSAWHEVVKLDPAGGDDANYSSQLARAAAGMPKLPTGPPDGTAFGAMTQADLETFLRAQLEAARAVQSRAAAAMKPEKAGGPPQKLDATLRASLQAELDATRVLFVAAGLEYALRGFPIRETAFHDGYAVLIFHDSEWRLPD
jgi:tetratricopeptide (TPR) repeat protein